MKYEVDAVERYPDYKLFRHTERIEDPYCSYIELSDEEYAEYQKAVEQYNYWQQKINQMQE